MHDLGKLVYLDLQKSGSTFVSRFLNETCTLPLVKAWKHGRIGRWDYRRDAFYFITIRNPIAQYSSLFRYGLDGRGGLYERLAEAGKADLYQNSSRAYNQWLRFVLDFKNAGLLGEDFERIPEEFNLGLLSYRYVMLSMVRPEKTVLKKPKGVDLLQFVKEKSIVDYVIRSEQLNEGLLELARDIKPEYFDQAKVQEFLNQRIKVNVSTVAAEELDELDRDVLQLITEKEKILLEFYPQSNLGRSAHL